MIKADPTDYGILRGNLVSDAEQTYIIENLLVQGISARRSENETNYDYRLIRDREDQGIRRYVHKYF